jgi:RNA polymerase sigma factor (TIGR02999 family)
MFIEAVPNGVSAGLQISRARACPLGHKKAKSQDLGNPRSEQSLLVDYSRRRGAEKRGPDVIHLPLDDALSIAVEEQFDLLALDGALEQLAAFDARKCQVVEMRFFAGLAAKEIAVVFKATEATVRRDWVIAKAWLFRYLEGHAWV